MLLIGNHLLEGKIASPPEPFAVLVRKEHKRPSSLSLRVGRLSITGEGDEGKQEQDGANCNSMAVNVDSAPDTAYLSALR